MKEEEEENDNDFCACGSSKKEEKKEKDLSDIEEELIRPDTFEDFIGQERLKANFQNLVEGCKEDNKILDHILLSGPSGTGKTTMGKILAHELNVQMYYTTGSSINKIEELISILRLIKRGDILFIDEIHELGRRIRTFLYPVMEDFHFSATIKVAGQYVAYEADMPRFTIIGATTQKGKLEKPFEMRFKIKDRTDFYEEEDLITIIFRSAKIRNYSIFRDGALEITKRAKFTPRIANDILKRVGQYAKTIKEKEITTDIVTKVSTKLMGIDGLGLDSLDRAYLKYLANEMSGGPAGIDNLKTALEEEKNTLEIDVEPYLIKTGFIKRTTRGRVLTKKGFDYLGIDMKDILAKKLEVIGGLRYRKDISKEKRVSNIKDWVKKRREKEVKK